jgi:hypothetical protein
MGDDQNDPTNDASLSDDSLAVKRQITEAQLGAIVWTEPDRGYCNCPGMEKHTSGNGPRDCLAIVSGVPTLTCFHQNCRLDVERVNHGLRRAIAKADVQTPAYMSLPVADQRRRAQEAKRELAAKARNWLPGILAGHNWPLEAMREQSPTNLPADPATHWRLLLGLFGPGDLVWIGRDVYQSGHQRNRQSFRRAEDWLKCSEAPGLFTCPSVFNLGTFSRCNQEVITRSFLVVESDTLDRDQIGAVFCWLRQYIRLRAVVDTAGKSLHGWFDFPDPELFEQLRVVLPQLGCDPAMFKASQPCRLPGALRDGNYQRILWLESD